jgi:hypothetical protein
VYQGEVLFLREKLEAQGRELEKERAAQRHLAADLNRELHNLNKQKEAEVHAVRYRNYEHLVGCGSGKFIPDPDFLPSRIQQQQKEGKKCVVLTLFCSHKFAKLEIILVFF